jgi:hypothetical protein
MQIQRPAEVVWPYLAALEQVPLREHGILDVRQVDPGPLFVGIGSRPGGSARALPPTSTGTSGSSRWGTSYLRPCGAATTDAWRVLLTRAALQCRPTDTLRSERPATRTMLCALSARMRAGLTSSLSRRAARDAGLAAPDGQVHGTD